MATPSCPTPVQWEPTPEDPTTQWTVADVNGCFAIAYETTHTGATADYDNPVTVSQWQWQAFGEDSTEIGSGSEPTEKAAKQAADDMLATHTERTVH